MSFPNAIGMGPRANLLQFMPRHISRIRSCASFLAVRVMPNGSTLRPCLQRITGDSRLTAVGNSESGRQSFPTGVARQSRPRLPR